MIETDYFSLITSLLKLGMCVEFDPHWNDVHITCNIRDVNTNRLWASVEALTAKDALIQAVKDSRNSEIHKLYTGH